MTSFLAPAQRAPRPSTKEAYKTWPQQQLHALISELDPVQDLVLFLFGAHELHRILSATHPNQ